MFRSMMLIAVLLLGALDLSTVEAPDVGKGVGRATWEAAMTTALELVEAKKIDELIDHQLSPAFIAKLKEQHGEEKWRPTIYGKLERLSYFYRHLKKAGNRTVEEKGTHIIVRGEYGISAEFDKVGDVYLIGYFGQEITSM